MKYGKKTVPGFSTNKKVSSQNFTCQCGNFSLNTCKRKLEIIINLNSSLGNN